MCGEKSRERETSHTWSVHRGMACKHALREREWERDQLRCAESHERERERDVLKGTESHVCVREKVMREREKETC